jgi:hypothetical protein
MRENCQIDGLHWNLAWGWQLLTYVDAQNIEEGVQLPHHDWAEAGRRLHLYVQ